MPLDVNPLRLMVLGAGLLAASWMTLLLMVIGELPRHLLLSLGAYVASVVGISLGMFGVVLYVRRGAP